MTHKWLTKPEITYIKRHPKWVKMEPINRLLADRREMRKLLVCAYSARAHELDRIKGYIERMMIATADDR